MRSYSCQLRKKILAAMDRLIQGKPLRSSGRLNVSQLAIEAAVPRWHLTHQHVDLKETFQAHVRNHGTTPTPFQNTADAYEELQGVHRALQARCTALEEQNKLYANVIQVLSTEIATGGQQRRLAVIAPRRNLQRGTSTRGGEDR